jgi:hypothetical protein
MATSTLDGGGNRGAYACRTTRTHADCGRLPQSHHHQVGTNWQSAAETRTCVCGAQWAGDACDVTDVPLLALASSGGETCAGGVVDVHGQCCMGYIDMYTGTCCDVNLDRRGECCAAPGRVVACGVCGGSGVAVDAIGVCCTSVLAPPRVSGKLESCGPVGPQAVACATAPMTAGVSLHLFDCHVWMKV